MKDIYIGYSPKGVETAIGFSERSVWDQLRDLRNAEKKELKEKGWFVVQLRGVGGIALIYTSVFDHDIIEPTK